jgi:hypothetical protein
MILGPDEYKLLGLWGAGIEDNVGAFEAMTAGKLEEHDYLAKIVDQELEYMRKDKSSNKASLTTRFLAPDGMKVTIEMPDGKRHEYDLGLGAVRVKHHSQEPGEDWLFICGRPV